MNKQIKINLKDLYDLKKEGFTNFKISSIENFTDNFGKYINKKPRCLYCSPENQFYMLIHKINVVNYPFNWPNRIPYSDFICTLDTFLKKFPAGLILTILNLSSMIFLSVYPPFIY